MSKISLPSNPPRPPVRVIVAPPDRRPCDRGASAPEIAAPLSADELARRLEEAGIRVGCGCKRYAASPAVRARVIDTWSGHATSLFATAVQGLRLFAELGPDHECSQSEAATQCWDFVARGLMVENGGYLDPFNRIVYDYMIACGAPLPCNFTTARRRLYLLRQRVRQTVNADTKLAAGRRLRIFERFMSSICAELAQRRFQKRRSAYDFVAAGARR